MENGDIKSEGYVIVCCPFPPRRVTSNQTFTNRHLLVGKISEQSSEWVEFLYGKLGKQR